MAGSNLTYTGYTGVLQAAAYVTEKTTSGRIREVWVRISIRSIDFAGDRNGGYHVACEESGTDGGIDYGLGYIINGKEKYIFDETFEVEIQPGSSTANINLSFDAVLWSPSAYAYRTITGSITELYLTEEPVGESQVSVGVEAVQMGKKLSISIARENREYTHTLIWNFGTGTGIIAEEVGTSYAWTVPDLAGYCDNATSGVCTIICKTWMGETEMGQTQAKVVLTVPEPVMPAIDGNTVTMGTPSTIVCARGSKNFTVRLHFDFQGATEEIREGKVDSCQWTPGYDLAKRIPSLTQATGKLTCVTMNGTAQVGSKTATIRAVVPDNSITRPSFDLNGLVLSPVSDLGADFAGLYLRGKTGLKAEFTASSQYSIVKSYSVTAGSASAEGNPATIGMLANDGSVKVSARVTDQRGYSTVVNTTVEVIPYRKPKVTPYAGYSNVLCERALASGELSPQGTFLAIKAGRSFSSVRVAGAEKNGCSLRYRWKLASAGSYGSWSTILEPQSQQAQVSVLAGNVVSDLTHSYDIQIQALDALGGEHTLTFPVMTEAISFVLFDGEDGAGFGKYPEEPHVVDIAAHMTLRVRGDLVVDGKNWESLSLAQGISEAAASCGRWEDSGCYWQAADGRHVFISFNCAFQWAGTALVINGQPIPAADRPPRTVYALCPANDGKLALVSAGTDGYIRVEWVQKLAQAGSTAAAEVNWIDGYLDYWK